MILRLVLITGITVAAGYLDIFIRDRDRLDRATGVLLGWTVK